MTSRANDDFQDALEELQGIVMTTGHCPVCGSHPGTFVHLKPTKAETRKEIKDRDARIEFLEEQLKETKEMLDDAKQELVDGAKVLAEERNEHRRLTRAYDRENKLAGALTKKLTEFEEMLPRLLIRVAKAKPPLPEASLKELVDMDRVGKELAKS